MPAGKRPMDSRLIRASGAHALECRSGGGGPCLTYFHGFHMHCRVGARAGARHRQGTVFAARSAMLSWDDAQLPASIRSGRIVRLYAGHELAGAAVRPAAGQTAVGQHVSPVPPEMTVHDQRAGAAWETTDTRRIASHRAIYLRRWRIGGSAGASPSQKGMRVKRRGSVEPDTCTARRIWKENTKSGK